MLPRTPRQSDDELIAGTDKDPTRLATLSDDEPLTTSDDEPAMAGA